ncbi:glycosyl hydrolase family 18 protein [Planosporangium mesophilum]|uniref:chitinase n=1 Tax=Planosporangium mesophilum TaxID=689768 RepID=A0A8J3TDV6_9ACTN|nr:glycosyl hydrolase family 18 protein [Planosporangium mesophilum]NJC82631.1 chitinase [Planosporangium mesophilum]GII24998.1 chitinase [Planosporangium mesophilum]
MNRRRVSLAAAGTAVLLVAGVVAAGTTSANAAGTVTASFSTNSWGTGQTATYTITNGTSSAITSWTVEFDLPSGTTLGSYWDALMSQSGNHVVARNRDYNGSVAAGGTTSFGFNTTGAGTPANCTVNGAPCGGGSAPPPTTAPPTTQPPSPTPTPTTTTPPAPPPSGSKVVGYFTEWGVYGRNYHVKNIHTSGSAAKLTHIVYAFGNTTGGRCSIGDSYADYDKAYSAADSVDGVADTWDAGALRGNFGQLRRLKKMYPNLKVVWSFGGWTWSAGFTQAAANPAAFADSCYSLVEDPRWADVFDGIDIDWEYPNACGLQCDTSGPNAFKNVISALRSRFGSSALVTAAITADGSNGGKIDATDYAGAATSLNWLMPMTYDYFGAFNAQGPTAPHSPLYSYSGIPQQGFYADAAIGKLKSKGVPASKLLLGIGFYGRGWTGVTQEAPGGTATGAAPGTYEAGIEDYKVLKNSCPANRTIAGTAYALCGNNWWSYDTPATIAGKMSYARSQGLGGAFFWELSGDTANGELIGAMR